MSFWNRANSPVADNPPAASTKGPLAAIENLAAPGSCGPSSGAPSASSKAASEASSGVGIEALGRSESVQKLLSRMERLPSVPALYTQVLSELARPQASIQIVDQAARRHIEVSQVEREIFDATHAELAACLLTAWGLPASILDAIAWHHSPAQSRDTGFSILTAVHVANAVEREKLLHKAGLLTNQMDFPYLDSLGLTGQRNSWREACGFPVFVVDDPKKERVGLRQAVRG